jgi:hypothetical protein
MREDMCLQVLSVCLSLPMAKPTPITTSNSIICCDGLADPWHAGIDISRSSGLGWVTVYVALRTWPWQLASWTARTVWDAVTLAPL